MTPEEFEEKVERYGLGEYRERLLGISRPCIRLRLDTNSDEQVEVGSSKLGGVPDLPSGVEWPFETRQEPSEFDRPQSHRSDDLLPLSFVAQINLSDIAPFDEDWPLPRSGMLYFFYTPEQDVWGFDPRDSSGFKVVFYDDDLSELKPRDFPESLTEYARFKACPLRASTELSFPDPWNPRVGIGFESDALFDAYGSFIEEGSVNKMLGFPDIIQNEMEIECEMVARGHYIGDVIGADHPFRKEAEPYQDDWKLLLQVDSVDECGMMWGDVGRLYFWMREEDMRSQRFDRVWMIFQCC